MVRVAERGAVLIGVPQVFVVLRGWGDAPVR